MKNIKNIIKDRKNYRVNAQKMNRYRLKNYRYAQKTPRIPRIIYITKKNKYFKKNKYIIKDILQETKSEVYFYCDTNGNNDKSILKNGKINSTFFKGGMISDWKNMSNIVQYIENKDIKFAILDQYYPKKNALIPILSEKNITILESSISI